ncbi:MAG: ABC transporter permease [Candidatus Thiodiazotropha lotti]|uniref:Transport permease protein n=1 Tax=Candidatus Thiodiazotropha lotti TaxID=2792787 RepID=A0A9E4K5I6_9GAMM|nr:ABC transporter permease [Candidatus Thiodiazotropha lotti]ODC01694.1 ABC transporter permease [Candidatus Thiodiazotropha endoloripes]MCG7921268.1 ABC transporter permease [Candidatus Thiodiazotropha lotti]MCG7930235.1 ABC transporter permease [Candidatus Thiodiazotropha lotti]MCG7939835.1 ABC transporter permease [Candidatus Thiodiazotropha lotti]
MSSGHVKRIAYQTIVTKEVLRFARIWVQTILPPAITTTLYFIIFGKLIGERIGMMEGYRYIEFIVPGLILMSVIQNSYANVVSSFFSTKLQHYIEELLIAPVPNWIVLAGYVTGGMARGLIVGTVVTGISLFFTDLTINSYSLTLLVFVLTSILFSLAGFINAVYAKSFDDIAIVPTFVLTPLTYLGGVFYSIQLLPEFWQQVSLANPVLYMINTFRYGLLGVSDIDVRIALVIIVAFIVVLTWYSLRLLSRGVGIKE